MLRHPTENLQNKGGNLASYSLRLFRLEIGNSVSQCYGSSPHDHDSGVQSLQQKKNKKIEKLKLGNPHKTRFLVLRRYSGVGFGINLGD